MSDKQLNFFNIFDQREEEKASSELELGRKLERAEKEKGGQQINEVRSSERIAPTENLEILESKKFSPQKLERLHYLLTTRQEYLSRADFQEFLPELKVYHQRYLQFKKDYREFDQRVDWQRLSSSARKEKIKEKEKLYWLTVDPTNGEQEIYQEIARLYVLHKDFLDAEAQLQNKPKAKVARGKTKKRNPHSSFSRSSQDSQSQKFSNNEEEIEYDESGRDPWGDIHPYSQARRKN